MEPGERDERRRWGREGKVEGLKERERAVAEVEVVEGSRLR